MRGCVEFHKELGKTGAGLKYEELTVGSKSKNLVGMFTRCSFLSRRSCMRPVPLDESILSKYIFYSILNAHQLCRSTFPPLSDDFTQKNPWYPAFHTWWHEIPTYNLIGMQNSSTGSADEDADFLTSLYSTGDRSEENSKGDDSSQPDDEVQTPSNKSCPSHEDVISELASDAATKTNPGSRGVSVDDSGLKTPSDDEEDVKVQVLPIYLYSGVLSPNILSIDMSWCDCHGIQGILG